MEETGGVLTTQEAETVAKSYLKLKEAQAALETAKNEFSTLEKETYEKLEGAAMTGGSYSSQSLGEFSLKTSPAYYPKILDAITAQQSLLKEGLPELVQYKLSHAQMENMFAQIRLLLQEEDQFGGRSLFEVWLEQYGAEYMEGGSEDEPAGASFISINTQKLRAMGKECVENNRDMPAGISDGQVKKLKVSFK